MKTQLFILIQQAMFQDLNHLLMIKIFTPNKRCDILLTKLLFFAVRRNYYQNFEKQNKSLRWFQT